MEGACGCYISEKIVFQGDLHNWMKGYVHKRGVVYDICRPQIVY